MLTNLKALARLTLNNPRGAAAALTRVTLDQAVLMQLAALVVALEVISSWVYFAISPAPQNPLVFSIMTNPLLLAVIQFMALMLTVFAVFLIGRAFGGTGTFEQSFLLIIWLEGYMVLWQTLVTGLALFSAGLAEGVNSAAFFYMLWLMVVFIATLHGFTSLLKVFLGMIAGTLVLSSVFAILLWLLGFH